MGGTSRRIVRPCRWEVRPSDEEVAQRLMSEAGLARALAFSLAGRGVGPEQLQSYLVPRLSRLSDPFRMSGMEDAVATLWAAVRDRARVVVYGDYDVDGISASALLVSVLNRLGACADVFLPDRLAEGYGLTAAGARRCCLERRPDLIVTVDCGISAVETVTWLQRHGVSVVVTDHHEPGPGLPRGVTAVNPKLDDDGDVRPLSGVGVAFKLCHGLVKHGLRTDPGRVAGLDLREWLDLVALGTVADVVPLRGENRILVKHGLERITGRSRPGLRALCEVAGLRGNVEGYHVGFVLGPRLNAAGRLGSARQALELLLTEDEETARRLAGGLDAMNRERRSIEAETLDRALCEVEAWFEPSRHFGIVVGDEKSHEGVVGIVASRLCSRYHRPCVVIAFDGQGSGKGSCRSIEGVDMLAALEKCSDVLESYGGHKAAAGLCVTRGNLEMFVSRFNDVCGDMLGHEDVEPVLELDGWLTLGEADEALLRGVAAMEPLGTGNPAPVWGVRGVRPVGRPGRVGKHGDHLKFAVASGTTQRSAIGFGLGDRKVERETALDVAFCLEENVFMGRRELQLNVKDLRPAL